MNVDLTQPMTTIDGNIIPNSKEDLSPVSAKTVCARALMTDLEDDKGKPEGKIKRFRCAEKIMNSDGVVDLEIEDMNEIETRLDKAFTSIIYCRVKEIFDHAKIKNTK